MLVDAAVTDALSQHTTETVARRPSWHGTHQAKGDRQDAAISTQLPI